MDPGLQTVVVSAVFLALAIIVVLLRLVTRLYIVKTPGLDDGFMLFALCLDVGLFATIEIQRTQGLGLHIHTLTPTQVETLMKSFYASVFLYNIGLMCAANSILLLFLRFFQAKRYRIAAWTMIGVCTSYSVVSTVTMGFVCRPLADFWDPTARDGRCVNLTAYWFFAAGSCILKDIILCVLPLPVLKSLHLPRRQKYALVFVFMLGGFGAMTAVARLYSVYVISKSKDPTYDNADAAMWSSLELSVGITTGSIPTLRPLFKLICPSLLCSTPHPTTLNIVPETETRQMKNSAGGSQDYLADESTPFHPGVSDDLEACIAAITGKPPDSRSEPIGNTSE